MVPDWFSIPLLAFRSLLLTSTCPKLTCNFWFSLQRAKKEQATVAPYYPSGSLVDGVAAALISHVRNDFRFFNDGLCLLYGLCVLIQKFDVFVAVPITRLKSGDADVLA